MKKIRAFDYLRDYASFQLVKDLITQVMGWECFGSWESYHHKYAKEEFVLLQTGQAYTTSTPVAFFVDYANEWKVFSADHEQLNTFDPLHSLKDLDLVVEKIATWEPQRKQALDKCAYDLLEKRLQEETEQRPAFLEIIPEIICKAALQSAEGKAP